MKFLIHLFLILGLAAAFCSESELENFFKSHQQACATEGLVRSALVEAGPIEDSCDQIRRWYSIASGVVCAPFDAPRDTSERLVVLWGSIGTRLDGSIAAQVSSSLYNMRTEIGVGTGDLASAWYELSKKRSEELDAFIAAAVGYMHALDAYNEHHGDEMPVFPPSFAMRALILAHAGAGDRFYLPILEEDIQPLQSFLTSLMQEKSERVLVAGTGHGRLRFSNTTLVSSRQFTRRPKSSS